MRPGGSAGDQSLVDHIDSTSQSFRGLDYPFGRWAPPAVKPHEIAPGVRWLRMPLPLSLDHINLWLLDDYDEHGPGTAIVDTGVNIGECREVWDKLLPGMRVTKVIVTHYHPDHVGLAGWLCQRTGATLWMSRTEYLMTRTMGQAAPVPPAEVIAYALDAGWPEESINALKRQSWGSFARAVSPLPSGYRRLADGDRIEIGGRMWRVIVGRGHTPEHVCLVSDDGQLMVAGDQVLPRITSNVSVAAIEPMANSLGDWLDSIERMRALPSGVMVLPAHGEPFHGLHERLDQLERGHRTRLDEVLAFCRTPRTIHECFQVIFDRKIDDSVIMMATGEALAHLRLLEVQGLVKRERHGTVLRFKAL